MSTRTIGTAVPITQNGPTAFRVQRKVIPALIFAIQGGQTNPMAPPVRGLLDFEMSGKMARRVGQIRRALHAEMVAIQAQRAEIEEAANAVDGGDSHAKLNEFFDEEIVIRCHGFSADELEKLNNISPRVLDNLIDLEIGGPTEITAEDAAEWGRGFERMGINERTASDDLRESSVL